MCVCVFVCEKGERGCTGIKIIHKSKNVFQNCFTFFVENVIFTANNYLIYM